MVILLPILVTAMLGATEMWVSRDSSPQPKLDADQLKTVVELDQELIKLFISLATALIGGIAYYVKSSGLFTRQTEGALPILVATTTASILSIFFGHLFLTNLRNQLALNKFNVHSKATVWPERLQYIFFLFALTWFALLALRIERRRSLSDEDDIESDEI